MPAACADLGLTCSCVGTDAQFKQDAAKNRRWLSQRIAGMGQLQSAPWRAAMSGRPPSSAVPRRLLAVAAVVYTTFVIYGSLVPLHFQALPWDVALARFAAIPFLHLAIGSRADWVANLLLFIPLTYLWMGLISAGGSRVGRVFATLLLIPTATALSMALEFTQIFFPARTVSQNDVMAETLGGLIGVGLWWLTGRRFVVWLQSWQRAQSRTELAERLAWTYLAGLVVYNVLPLDLTINPIDLFHKWREGRLNLLPFASLPAGAGAMTYELASDVLIWAPVALLLRLAGTRSVLQIWRLSVLMACALEAMQFFVYSRFSDVTDVLTAALGTALGLWVGTRVATRKAPTGGPLPSWRLWLPFGLALGWLAVILLVFWFPFDFRSDGAFIRDRLGFVFRVPFETYYIGSEFRAITEVLHKMLLFAPLGGLLAWGVLGSAWRWRGLLFVVAMLTLIATPMLVELGQVMLPNKVPDTVDGLFGWLGGFSGYGLVRRLLRARRRIPAGQDLTDQLHNDGAPQVLSVETGFFWQPLFVLGGATLACWGAAHSPQLPYNLRELLQPQSAWRSAVLLALVYYWFAAWPVWLARRRAPGLSRFAQLSFGLALYGALVFGLLNAAVPEESLHDMVGFPLLHWPGQWEVGLRWMVLAAVPGALLYLAAQTVRRWRGKHLGALHYWAALPVLLLGYWVIVAHAATDNLTELMAAPLPLAFAALCAWLYVLFLGAALLASPLPAGWQRSRWLAVALSLPIAAGFLYFGLAERIDKYGQQFAAIQFLLSTDRQHYAPIALCWQRYAIVHGLVLVALALVQMPWFRGGQDRRRLDPRRAINH